FEDKALDGKTPDVLVIGGGIVGAATARELRKLNLSVLLVDKANDVATATSSRNDGCIHVGMDLTLGQQKLKYVLRGNKIYDTLSKELDIKFKRWAQIFIFSTKWEKFVIAPLYILQSKILGIPGVRYISADELKKLEPNPPSWATGAMYMASGGVVSPYKTTISLADNAIENGAEISLNTIVKAMEVENGVVKSVSTNRGTIYPKAVVNAAGCFADIVADMAGDRTFTIHPRKGTDVILDKKKVGYALSSFTRSYFTPLPKEAQPLIKKTFGHTKGGGVMRTVDGNILVGPDAEEVPSREDTSTSLLNIEDMFRKQKLAAQKLSKGDIITYFAGVRAATYEEDFVVRRGIFTKNIYEAAGIQSPGITAAPAIAEDICQWIKEDFKATENPNFNPIYKHTPRLADADEATRASYIEKNPAYGEIICRCEEVSRGEIVDALNSPLHVATLDGIKRRVRPGMGRCQGGFCSPLVASIIAEHEGISVEEVLKGEQGSNILFGNTKNASSEASEVTND
ncbi:MAG: NAD(P)/FAD-dependent oxidoreductase, partial [Clostridia bacterium]